MSFEAFRTLIPDLVERAQEMLAGQPEGRPEDSTKDRLLEPLLDSLGFDNLHRTLEAPIRSLAGTTGWVDYFLKTTRHSRIPAMMVEAKSLWSVGLWETHQQQVLNYLRDYLLTLDTAGPVDWIAVTNFREWHFVRLGDRKPFWSFGMNDLLNEDFAAAVYQRLARAEFERDRLYEYYSERQRARLGPQFLEDLKVWRLILATAIREADPDRPLSEVKQGSQIILNRLLFVRILEAYGREPFYSLGRLHYMWTTTFRNRSFSEGLREKFEDTWESYNTELFAHSWVDDVPLPQHYLELLILPDFLPPPALAAQLGRGLFDYRSIYNYDFTTLSQDVLGTAYEQFLAHELQETADGIRIIEDSAVRKREGVYYTPDYVVAEIVRKTVGEKVSPLIDEAIAALADGDYQRARETAESALQVRIVDPACGSGSFLLEAFTYVDRELDRYNQAVHREQVERTATAAGWELGLEATALPQILERHEERIVVQMLHGVDLDPQAVSLAKLSLWTRLLRAKPSEFGRQENRARHLPALNVNIRTGNSLINPGAAVATDDQLRQAATAARRAKDVFLADERRVEAADELREFWATCEETACRSLTTVFCSDNTITQTVAAAGIQLPGDLEPHQVRSLLAFNQRNAQQPGHETEQDEEGVLNAADIEGLAAALADSDEAVREVAAKRPFSWHCEFPDIFSPERGRAAGFDVVVGNPPYYKVDLTFGRRAPELLWLTLSFPDIHTDKTDVLYYFLCQGERLLAAEGELSFIVSRAFLQADKAALLRNFLARQTTLVRIIDFLGNKVFRAGIATAIVHLRGSPPQADHELLVANVLDFSAVRAALEAGEDLHGLPPEAVNIVTVLQADLREARWGFGPYEPLFDTMREGAIRLGDLPGVRIAQGMQTAADEVFVRTADEFANLGIPEVFLRPRASTEHIRPFAISDNNIRVLYVEGVRFDDLPMPVRNWFNEPHNRALLEGRASFDDGVCDWYQFARPRNADLHFRPKVLVSYRAPENRFAVDATGAFVGLQDTYAIMFEENAQRAFALAALLNSTPANFIYRALGGIGKLTGRGMFEYYSNQLRDIPLPHPQQHPEEYVRLHKLSEDLHRLLATAQAVTRAFSAEGGGQLHEEVPFLFYVDPAGPYGGLIALHTHHPHLRANLLGLEIQPTHQGFEIWGEVTEDEDWAEGERERLRLATVSVQGDFMRRFLLACAVYRTQLDQSFQRRQRLTREPVPAVGAALEVLVAPLFHPDVAGNLRVIQRISEQVEARLGRADLDAILLESRAAREEIDDLAFGMYGLQPHREQVTEALQMVL